MNIQGFALANEVPKMRLVCPRCAIVKEDVEEMEIHVKIEHLEWLPFQCPICHTLRASDGQMREHIFSGHGMVGVTQYLYIDNLEAKRELAALLNHALFRGLEEATSNEEMEPMERVEESPSGIGSIIVKQEPDSAESTPKREEGLMALLGEMGSNSLHLEEAEPQDNPNTSAVNIFELFNAHLAMQNLAGLFPATTPDDSKRKPATRASTGKGSILCNSCQSFIAIRSRGAHIYHHLHKDYNEPRFRCRWAECDWNGPRKDLLEFHQAKTHGSTSLEFTEDRIGEINHLYKTVSQQLFGQNADSDAPVLTPIKPLDALVFEDNVEMDPIQVPDPKNPSAVGGKRSSTKMELYKCEKCNTQYKAETRGLHVLWHLYEDKGVVRYSCKECGYEHKLSDIVAQHAAKAHGMTEEEGVVDSLDQHKDTLDEISMAYFGEPFDVINITKKPKRSRKRQASVAEKQSGGDTGDEMLQGDDVVLQGRTKQRKPGSEPEVDVKEQDPPSAEQKIQDAKMFEKTRLSEISRTFGGCQYLARHTGQAVICRACLIPKKTALTEHAYVHMPHAPFGCPVCEFDNASRKYVAAHLKDKHPESDALPVDRRLKYAAELKETMRRCYEDIFVDAPLPTNADLEKLTRGAAELLLAEEQGGGDS